jgi:hypothetical protein
MLVWMALKTNVNLDVDQSEPASFLNLSNAIFFLTLTQMLDMITYDQVKTYKLCVDGKKINLSSSQVDGEVNLFGFEDNPTFQENSLDHKLSYLTFVLTFLELSLIPVQQQIVRERTYMSGIVQ